MVWEPRRDEWEHTGQVPTRERTCWTRLLRMTSMMRNCGRSTSNSNCWSCPSRARWIKSCSLLHKPNNTHRVNQQLTKTMWYFTDCLRDFLNLYNMLLYVPYKELASSRENPFDMAWRWHTHENTQTTEEYYEQHITSTQNEFKYGNSAQWVMCDAQYMICYMWSNISCVWHVPG